MDRLSVSAKPAKDVFVRRACLWDQILLMLTTQAQVQTCCHSHHVQETFASFAVVAHLVSHL